MDVLVRKGFPVRAWHGAASFKPAWFSADIPTVYGPSLLLKPGDVLVVPEFNPEGLRSCVGDAKPVVLCQNHHYVLGNCGFSQLLSGDYPGLPGVAHVIGMSRAIMSFLAVAAPAVSGHYIPCHVDVDLFRPRAKKKLIAYMPRRRTRDLQIVVQLLRRSKRLADWEFVAVDGLTEKETAVCLGEAAIFLSGSNYEGFGLPPAEAMAAGCYVIGFNGDGGREYMDPDYCTVIEDQNVVQFFEKTIELVEHWDAKGAEIGGKIGAASRQIRNSYGRNVFEQHVVDVFTALLDPRLGAAHKEPAKAYHYEAAKMALAHKLVAKGRKFASKMLKAG